MSFAEIKEKIYDLLEAVAVVDGNNYDWDTIRRLDTHTKEVGGVYATIHYPDDEDFATEVLDQSTNEYRLLERDIEIKCRVKSDATLLKQRTAVDLFNDAVDKVEVDCLKALNSSSLGSCSLGVQRVDYITMRKESVTSKSGYYPNLVNLRFMITYKMAR